MGGIRKSSIPKLLDNLINNMASSEGMFLAQYKVLRANGHTPSEAFNETVEEATQSLYPLIGAKG
jgi:ketol-acid reductoisomerase